MHVWFPVKKSLFRIAGISYFNTTVTSLTLVFTIYLIFYAITLCFIMFICPFVGPLIWTNKILDLILYHTCTFVLRLLHHFDVHISKIKQMNPKMQCHMGKWPPPFFCIIFVVTNCCKISVEIRSIVVKYL